ncbi:MAG TPA: DUF4430 domain-containing protein [Solirubrobacterales bacterium]|nr:DUF4430 domain-containing protein [Solirubrobacterales bacterium]
MAVAIALLGAALAAAGCGLGPGADVGSVELTVTREYGTVPVLRRAVEAKESDTVMRVLEANADVETRFGGGYVHSIDGVAEGERGGDPYDWFFYMDGVESPVGAASVDLGGGESVWWDYRDWSATNHVPAVVGQWPAPFLDADGAQQHPVAVQCATESRGSFRTDDVQKEPRVAWAEACELTRKALEREGVELTDGSPKGAVRVLVGPWDKLRDDAAAQLLEAGPAESGVFADFEATGDGYELVALDEDGGRARRLGTDAGLVAATSRYGGAPIWFVTGGTPAAVRAAADLLDEAHLRDHYAVAIEDGTETPLPLEAR